MIERAAPKLLNVKLHSEVIFRGLEGEVMRLELVDRM